MRASVFPLCDEAAVREITEMMRPRSQLSLLVFSLDRERCALVADKVREVVRAVAVASLPKAPAIVEGVINVRGEIVPVLDIRGRFGLPPAALHPDQHFIVVRAGARTVALRVDRAHDLVEVDARIVESPAVAPGAKYLAGIARLADGLLVIHDIESFLSLDEGRAVDRAISGAPMSAAGISQPVST
jgi:purine-binding chemotaxis protein CheW